MTDTIVAIATAPSSGAIGVIRLSGPRAIDIACEVTARQSAPTPRKAVLARVRDHDETVIDEGLLISFPAPASYTGENSAELQLHGNPYILQQVHKRCMDAGARMAEPGEFSRRAFENHRIDLVQAEAVADLIAAESLDAARAAQQSLQGVFSDQCQALADDTLALRALIEAWLDFPEEDLGDAQLQTWERERSEILQKIQKLRRDAEDGARLTLGMTILIVGAPNAGKSTLLNALAQRDVAIVSEIAGTTRDIVSEHLNLNGVPVRILDSAGLREHSDDPIEKEGMRRAETAANSADRILALEAADAPLPPIPSEWESRLVRIRNKSDLSDAPAGNVDGIWHISALRGTGLDELVEHLAGRASHASAFSARQRHLEAIGRAMIHVEHSQAHLKRLQTLELGAEELRLAQIELGRITGEVHTEDMLGKIFSTFCIGK